MGDIKLGESAVTAAFGASTSVSTPDQGMYLVVGRNGSPDGIIAEAGGSIVLRLSNLRSLAMLSFEAYLQFMRTPRISFIGPVSVDQQRFERFLSLFGASSDQPAAVREALESLDVTDY